MIITKASQCQCSNIALSRCMETAATATLCRLPSRTTSPGVWIVRDSLLHVRTLLLVRFSIFPTNAILMEQRFQRRVNKISFTGHSQCDHPQLFCGQGQHHRRVDSSKCYDWRGRLRGKCLIHLFKFLIVCLHSRPQWWGRRRRGRLTGRTSDQTLSNFDVPVYQDAKYL